MLWHSYKKFSNWNNIITQTERKWPDQIYCNHSLRGRCSKRKEREKQKKNASLSPIWALVTQAIVNTCSLSGWYQTISHWLSVNNIFWLKQMKASFHWANHECYKFLPCLACGKLFFIEWISLNTQFFENLCRCETNKLHIIMSYYKYISSTGNAVLILDTPTSPA